MKYRGWIGRAVGFLRPSPKGAAEIRNAHPSRAVGPRLPREGGRFTKDAYCLAALALAIRVLVVAWAKDRFPPTDDGTFYHVVAQRIAHGAGYTWLWPDGAVSYAAHYPVGYPALIGFCYALFGARPVVAMGCNALFGALSVFAGQRIALRTGTRGSALIAALLLALHPGLVFYTPALMTEGVAAELLVVAVWLALRADEAEKPVWRLTALGLCFGALTLIRPQLLILAPIFGFFTLRSASFRGAERALRALCVSIVALALCLPWTIRNCKRMDSCVFVSANGGWNLLIGSMKAGQGAWLPIEGERVPVECRTVFGEADKDRCFGRAGFQRIANDPLSFLALVPRKLSVTFDYFGAPGQYLHNSNLGAFDEVRKLRLGIVETLWERVLLLAALLQSARQGMPRRRARCVVAFVASAFTLSTAGWVGYLGLVLVTVLSGRELVRWPVRALSAALVLCTALTHSLFFGAGRYGFVCAALLCLLAVGERERLAGPAAFPASDPVR